MKIYLIFFCLLFSISGIRAQTESLPPFRVNYGFYRTFRNLENNKPFRGDSFHIELRPKANKALLGGGFYTFVLDSADEKEFKVFRREMIGISDGKQFYISDKFTIGGWMGYAPCFLNGPFIIALIHGSAAQYTGGGVLPGLVKTGRGFVIDIRTGLHARLTQRTIRYLLKDYPDLKNAYKDKGNLMDYAVEIISRINEQENN